MTKIEQSVKSLVEPIINEIGYKVYDVIYEKEGKDNYLRIFIDSDEKTIDINDCEKVNDAINSILDEKDPIKSSYMLEVSSPGLERRIRSDEHLKQALNKEIEVHTFKNISDDFKLKEVKGILKSFDDESIVVLPNENNDIKKGKTKSNKTKKSSNQKDDDFKENANDNLNTEKEIIINKQNISNMKTVYNWED